MNTDRMKALVICSGLSRASQIYINDAHTKPAPSRVFVCAPAIPARLFVIDAHTKQPLTHIFVCAAAFQPFGRESSQEIANYLRH